MLCRRYVVTCQIKKHVLDTIKGIVSNKTAIESIVSDAITDYVKLISLTPEKMKEMMKK